MYSEKVIKEFKNPKNMGEIKDADGIGKIGNPVCGDVMHVYIKVKNNKITDIKFKTFGCVAAIATSSVMTKLVKGKSIEKALKLNNNNIAKALDGLPPMKLHCSNLAAEALHKAIENYKKTKK